MAKTCTAKSVTCSRTDGELVKTRGSLEYETYPSDTNLVKMGRIAVTQKFLRMNVPNFQIRHFMPSVPIVLVANKLDLRNDPETIKSLYLDHKHPVTAQEGREMAQKVGACAFLECSAKTNEGVTEVFQAATRAALAYQRKKNTLVLV